MILHSSSLKTDCRNENTTYKLWENSLIDFYNSIHVARKITIYFSMYGILKNIMKETVFFYVGEHRFKLTLNRLQKQ